MSIRLIARELYRLERDAETLESLLKNASPEERDDMEQRLRRLKAERDRLRAILEAKKEPPPYRRAK
jgi:hypothetical protein